MAVQKALVMNAGKMQLLQAPDSLILHGKKNLGGSTLTIASGVVTKTTGYHKIETEAAAASDDLATINGGTNGDILILTAADDAHTVVVKDGTGNIITGLGDISLDSNKDVLTLVLLSTTWFVLGQENN